MTLGHISPGYEGQLTFITNYISDLNIQSGLAESMDYIFLLSHLDFGNGVYDMLEL